MLKDELTRLIGEAIQKAQQQGSLPSFPVPAVEFEHPREAARGDYSTSVALKLAREAKMPPLQIAQAISAHLPADGLIGAVEVAPPGFINVRLSDAYVARQVDEILTAGEAFGNVDVGHGQPAQVEFVSANPTGPLHVGRTWGAVLGDAIARVLEAAGYRVTREYYFNNAGRQMQILGESVRARYRERLGRPFSFPKDGYEGQYIYHIAQAIVDEVGAAWAEADWPPFKERAEAWLFVDIRKTLERMGIRFDVWFNENDLYTGGAVERTLQALRDRGYAYDAGGAVWFRATEFGADKDRVLVRSNGEPTYRLPDIAYHVNKLERGFALVVNVFGADHIVEYPDVIAGIRALGYDAGRIRVVIHQFINLVRGGQEVRMSTRRANYVTLDDLLDEVTLTHPDSGVTIPGKDPVRFMLLTRSPDARMKFDLALAVEQSDKNPVYYVQYAHARIASILRVAAERGQDHAGGDVSLLTHPAEQALIRKMLELPEHVDLAARQLTPHVLTHYSTELATAFHAFYKQCRVVSSDPADREITRARLQLVRAARQVLARTLNLMGMDAPERM